MTPVGPRPLVLVNSGAYAHQELSAEFGLLPPAFLPVGLGRLYELQVRALAPLAGEIHLTLPESFEIPAWDVQRLAELEVNVVRTPDALSMGAALLYALGRIGFSDRPLHVLHGDTLVESVGPADADTAFVAPTGDGYRWAVADVADERVVAITPPDRFSEEQASGPRLCGYFAFQSVSEFAQRLALSQGDFFAALESLIAERGLVAAAPAKWFDFGHVQTFFQSRRIVTTARAFNAVEFGDAHVRKRSPKLAGKLKAEARWLRDVPSSLSPYCARMLGEGEDNQGYFYDTEYEYLPTLAELFVLGELRPASWRRILLSCAAFADSARAAGAGALAIAEADSALQDLVVRKTTQRLHGFAASAGIRIDAPNTLNDRPAPSLQELLADIEAVVQSSGSTTSVMHGDFCFSNILYNIRTDRIRLIDPRGLTEAGDFSLYGDLRYDLAKLMHSLVGRYDLIVAGRFTGGRTGDNAFRLEFEEPSWRAAVVDEAERMTMGGVRLDDDVVWAAMLSLFLSMPPLHADRPDRQQAFIANALRLHGERYGARQ